MRDHDPNQPLPESFDWNDIYYGDHRDRQPPDPTVLAIAEGLPPGTALDVGCGAGGLLVALAQRGWEVHGIDIAPKAIAAAEQVLAGEGVTASLAAIDAAHWTPPRRFDLVTNCFALPLRREEQRSVLEAIRAAVAPGGLVVVKDFDPAMARLAPFRGVDLVAVDQLTEAFAGFEVIRAEVVETPAHHHGEGTGDAPWTAALLVARRPGESG